MADEPIRRPRWRRALRVAALLALAIVLLVGLAVVLRLTLAAWVVENLIADTPFENATFRITRLEPNEIVVEDLALDRPIKVAVRRLTITYNLADALDGRIDAIDIDGLDATARPDELTAVTGGDGDGMPVEIAHVTIRDSIATLALGGGDVRLAFDGEATSLTPPSGTFTMTAKGESFDLGGRLDVAPSGEGGIAATWHLDDGAIDMPDGRLGGLKGDLLVEMAGGGPLDVNVTLSSDDVQLARHDLANLHLEAAARIDGAPGLDTVTGEALVEFGTATAPVHGTVQASLAQGEAGPELVADTDLDLNEDLALAVGGGIAVTAPASLSAHVAASLPAEMPAGPVDPLTFVLAHVADLSAEFAAAGFSAADLFSAAAVDGKLVASQNGGDVTVVLTTPITANGLILDPALIAGLDLDPETAALVTAPTDLAIAGGDLPLRLSHRPDGGGLIDGDLAVTAKSALLEATVSLDGGATVLADGSPGDVVLRQATLSADLAHFLGADALHIAGDAGGSLEGGALEASGQITASANAFAMEDIRLTGVSMSLPFDATGSGDMATVTTAPSALASFTTGQFGDIRTGPVEIEMPLRLAGMVTNLMVYVDDNGWIDVGGMTHPSFVVSEPVSIRIEQNALPLLAVEISDDNSMTWDGRIHIAPPAISLTLLDDGGLPEAHITGTLPSFRVHLTRLFHDYVNATVETADGDLLWDEQNLQVSGMRMLLTYNAGMSPWPQVRFDIDKIGDVSSPARIADLTADLRVTPVWPAGKDVRASLNVHAPQQRYALNVEASYEPAKNLATAFVRLPPLVFEPGGYQPKNLSPAAGAYVRDVSGSVEVSGEIDWQDGVFSSDLDLAVRDLSAEAFGTRVERLNTVITFDNVAPLSTPPGQLIAIAGIDAGLPLRDALISIDIDPDGLLLLENAAMTFAGGEVTSSGARWVMSGDPEPLVLQVTGVDVATLFALADMEDLTATGTLDGTIPVRFANGDLIIEGANLASRQPGELHYLPADVPAGLGTDAESVDLVLDALSNFHYQTLKVDLDRAAGGETVIGLHIAGANPDLYDGYPIELNVTLTGALDQIVRDSLAGYRIPEEIQERLSGF